jgi:3-oxoacyl-(acyl-carrier-protein) synthase/thioesterase domain-containing protein
MQTSAIAVIGMAGRFPGAPDVRRFWKNLSEGVESVRFFDDDELRAGGETEEALSDASYVKACAQLDGIDMFDAGFFGMSPRDAAIFDPQHRLFLECAWEAFEHAGYVGESILGPVGVFASCGMSEYLMKNVMAHREVMSDVGDWLIRHTGNDGHFLATRVSYELCLRGPSIGVQTACSSSLVAIHLACQSLLSAECDLALAGGSTIYPEQNRGYYFREGGILSADGHTRSFDVKATGTTLSSAVACVLLKRLTDAERDRDNVLAVILGSAVNNDGRDKVSYFAPSVSGQAQVVSEALAVAGVGPEEISYVEAHGTATSIGDPIEVTAMTQAFRAGTKKTAYCAIGSLKPNIGHAAEASGAAAFIKTLLALEHRQIPPSLNCETPNPRCQFESSPFFVNTTLTRWTTSPRIAGVTSLGVGGTNCHVIVTEPPEPPFSMPSKGPELIVLSAKTAAALESATRNMGRWLEDHPEASLADVAFTLALGRKAHRHRRFLVAASTKEAALLLRDGLAAKQELPARPRGVALLFPGEDAAWPGMGRPLYEEEAAYRDAIDRCLAVVPEEIVGCLRRWVGVVPIEARDGLAADPSLAALALFAVEYAMGSLLHSWGVKPLAMLGQGSGEYAAACVEGAMSIEEGVLAAMSGAPVASAAEFERRLRALIDGQALTLIEVGPSGTLSEPPKRCGASVHTTLLTAENGASEKARLLLAMGAMWAAGEVTLEGLYEGRPCRRVTLPTYPWQRQRYWLGPTSRDGVHSSGSHLRRNGAQNSVEPELGSAFVAPRTELEREICGIWGELLGLDRLGVRDDFFELGGQSIVAVRFFTRIRKRYGVDLPLSTLLDSPTVEGCAALLAAAFATQAPAAPPETSAPAAFQSLVTITRGDPGRVPFFCVHGAGGNVLNFRDLSHAMGSSQPFYGLQARGIDGVLAPRESIDSMASAYLEEVRALWPDGPYLLGGYSGGGLIALEMARRITDSKGPSVFLALIDTLHPKMPIRKMTFARRVERARLEGLAYFRTAWARSRERGHTRRRLAEAARLVARGEPVPTELRDVWLTRSFQAAVEQYRPLPWSGRAILFRPDQLEYIYGDVRPAYGWEDVISELEVARVSGTHESLLLGPYASVLYDALRRASEQFGQGAWKEPAAA